MGSPRSGHQASGVRRAIISFGKSSVGEHGEAGRAVRQTQVWSCVRESGQGQRGSADHHTVPGRFGKAIGSPDSQGLPVCLPPGARGCDGTPTRLSHRPGLAHGVCGLCAHVMLGLGTQRLGTSVRADRWSWGPAEHILLTAVVLQRFLSDSESMSKRR